MHASDVKGLLGRIINAQKVRLAAALLALAV